MHRVILSARCKRTLLRHAALALLLCCGAISSAWTAPLVLALSTSPLSLPVYVAQSQGYFEAEGVQLKVVDVIGGVRTLQQLRSGEADLATSSESVVMFNSFGARDFSLLASFVTSAEDVRLIVGPGLDPAQPRRLEGKRIGTIVASASHYYLDTWLLVHGIDPKKITVVSLAPEAMEAALASGAVDAVSVWEPFGFKILGAVPGAKALPNPGAYTLSFNLLVNSRQLGQRDEELTRILKAVDRAERFIKERPVEAQTILRDRLHIDQAFVDWIWPRYRFQLSLNQSLLSTLESEARWARSEGHIKADRIPNFLALFHTGPLRAARADAVGIVK